MKTPNHNPNPAPDHLQLRHLIILWATCCVSPILYLIIAAIILRYFMDTPGYWPLSDTTHQNALNALLLLIILLQFIHTTTKLRARKHLTPHPPDSPQFLHILTRRTYILTACSELAVFGGFLLFLAQGQLQPILISGIAAMILYAQSHPHSTWPK